MAAGHLNTAESHPLQPISRLTRYSAILGDYIARQLGAAALLGDETHSVAVLCVKFLEASLRAANLRHDERRLEAFIAKHLPNKTATPPAAFSSGGPVAGLRPDYRQALETTATALDTLVEHAEVFAVDPITKVLIDRFARPGSAPVFEGHLMEKIHPLAEQNATASPMKKRDRAQGMSRLNDAPILTKAQ